MTEIIKAKLLSIFFICFLLIWIAKKEVTLHLIIFGF